MNVLIRVSLLINFAFSVPEGSLAQSSDSLRMESANKSRLVNGLEANDESVFAEVSRLPIAQAAPLLLVYVGDASTNRERAEKARDAIRRVPGFSAYMKQRILEKRSRAGGEYDMQEFRLLKAIGGEEAAAAVAPFLFVNDPPLMVADDYGAGPIRYDALNSLEGMHLADAPKDSLDEWKAWAEKKGYRDAAIPPLMTLEQKGVPPEAIARSDAILAGARASSSGTKARSSAGVQTPSPAPTNPSSVPLQSATPETSLLAPTVAQTSAAPVHRRPRLWAWVVGICALLVIVAFGLKRRVEPPCGDKGDKGQTDYWK